VTGAHDGYAYLRNSPVHRRSWAFRSNELEISDDLSGAPVAARARFIVASDLALERASAQRWVVLRERNPVAEIEVLTGRGAVVDAWSALRFGSRQPTRCLEVELSFGAARIRLRW
jgi:hypothetical protein